MWKNRDLFKKIRGTMGRFHSKLVAKKDRNSMDFIETEDIKKRWKKYTEDLYKKILMTTITTMMWSLS